MNRPDLYFRLSLIWLILVASGVVLTFLMFLGGRLSWRPPDHGIWSKVSVLSSVSPWAIEPGACAFGPRYHGSFTWLRLPPLTWSSSSVFSSMPLFSLLMSSPCIFDEDHSSDRGDRNTSARGCVL